MKIKLGGTQKSYAFVHLLLFICPRSGDPMATACVSDKKSLEELDSHSFHIHCNCGWSGKLLGIKRLKSWVDDWNNALETPSYSHCS